MNLRHWGMRLATLICFSQIAFAQTSDWAAVSQLLSGQRVKIQTADGKSHVGNVQSVNEAAIRIGKNESIQKEDVQHLFLWSPGHHGRNALIGLAIGAGVGVGFGAACGGKDSIVSKPACMAVGAPLFGGVGAGIGALLPSHGRWHEAYRNQ